MKFTRLGRSGLEVSRLAFGMMGFGAPQWRPWTLGEDDARPIVRRAVELGVNYFDTADQYSAGESEILTGKLLREFGQRDDWVIATKVYNPVSFDFKSGQDPASTGLPRRPNRQGLSRKRLFAAVDASLRRLGTDYIDLYQIHRWDYDVPAEEFMEALHDIVKSGKVRYLGASSMWAWQFGKAQQLAERHGWTRFVSMQNHYNLVYREEEREMMPLLRDSGVACVPWSPLARGFLAVEPVRDAARSKADQIRWDEDPLRPRYYGTEADVAIAAEVGCIARDRQVSRAAVAIAWLLAADAAAGGVAAPVVGVSGVAQIEALAAATDLTLSGEEIRRLEAPYRPKQVYGHY